LAAKDIHLQPMRLLLVDDNADNRLVVVSYLKGQPVQVVEATDGTEAVEKVMKEKFDLVFMDMHMPVMDGYEATAEIRRLGNSTPIVALTAYAMKEEIDRILNVGCMDRLSKPITRARLLNYIAQFQQTVQPQQIAEEVIDDDIKALIPEYLTRRRQDVSKLQEHLLKKDIAALRSISHNLRGTALSYGQPQLDVWAQAMGKAAHSENWQEIEQLVEQFPTLLPKES
jgi:CheY-like chemotaxis protein